MCESGEGIRENRMKFVRVSERQEKQEGVKEEWVRE